MSSSRLLIALAAGFLVGAAVVGVTPIHGATPAEYPPDPDDPPRTFETVPVCANATPAGGGWVHALADGNRYAVTLNATFAHGENESIATWLHRRSGGRYVLDVWTVNRTDGAGGTAESAEPPCPPATRVEGAITLPVTATSLTVVYEGEPVVVVHPAADRRLWDLPSPVAVDRTNETAGGTGGAGDVRLVDRATRPAG